MVIQKKFYNIQHTCTRMYMHTCISGLQSNCVVFQNQFVINIFFWHYAFHTGCGNQAVEVFHYRSQVMHFEYFNRFLLKATLIQPSCSGYMGREPKTARHGGDHMTFVHHQLQTWVSLNHDELLGLGSWTSMRNIYSSQSKIQSRVRINSYVYVCV